MSGRSEDVPSTLVVPTATAQVAFVLVENEVGPFMQSEEYKRDVLKLARELRGLLRPRPPLIEPYLVVATMLGALCVYVEVHYADEKCDAVGEITAAHAALPRADLKLVHGNLHTPLTVRPLEGAEADAWRVTVLTALESPHEYSPL